MDASPSNLPTAKRLRDLIIDFYSVNDPEKLRYGLDVNGMVLWTQRNGLDALNQVLYAQCGKRLNLKKNLGNARKKALRISTAFRGPDANPEFAEAARLHKQQQEIVKRLQYYYEKHDPDRLYIIYKLARFAMYHGEGQLNKKLVEKYGEPLPKQLPREYIEKYNIPVDPARDPSLGPPKSPPPIGQHFDYSNAANTSLGYEPPLPPRDQQLNETEYTDEEVEQQLRWFFEVHDPEKLDALEVLVDLVNDIGREEINRKLDQLYGEDLDVITAVKKFGLKPESDNPPDPPPKTPRQTFPRRPNNKKHAPTKASKVDGQPRRKETDRKHNYIPPSPQANHFVPSTSPRNKKHKPAPKKYTGTKPRPVKDQKVPVNRRTPRPALSPGEGACDSYRLDMIGDSFGTCVCGFPRGEHSHAARNKKAKPSHSMQKIKSTFEKNQSTGGKTTYSRALKYLPGNERNLATTRAQKVKSRQLGGKPNGKPCSNFRLDIYGQNYGDCVCGFSKAIHTEASIAKSKHGPVTNTHEAKKRYQATLERKHSNGSLGGSKAKSEDNVNSKGNFFGWKPPKVETASSESSLNKTSTSPKSPGSPHNYIPPSPKEQLNFVPKTNTGADYLHHSPLAKDGFVWEPRKKAENIKPIKRKKKKSSWKFGFLRKRAPGVCRSCGLTLGSKSNFCPECGASTK